MTSFEKTLPSRVLVLESDPSPVELIKDFCGKNNLIAVRPGGKDLLEILKSNIDLGAILLSEDNSFEADGIADVFELALRIHNLRKELPIFLRRADRADLDDIAPEKRAGIAGAYTLKDQSTLSDLVDQFLADTEYPISLIKRIEEITISSLQSLFRDVEIHTGLPYLVKDKLTYGDILSLLPVDSPWFSGYMMVQSEENPMLEMIRDSRTALEPDNVDFRDVMGMLSEISNLAWGGLRTKLLAMHPAGYEHGASRISVPITVNQYKEYISFGSDRAQLCLKYTLTDIHGKLPPAVIFQKFIFNIRWSPEEYREADENTVDDMVESGELELF